MHVVLRVGGDVQRVRSPERAAAVAATRGDDEHAWQSLRLLVHARGLTRVLARCVKVNQPLLYYLSC